MTPDEFDTLEKMRGNEWSWRRVIFGLIKYLAFTVIAGFCFGAFKDWNDLTVTIRQIQYSDDSAVIAGKFRRDSANLEWAERKAKLKAGKR